MNEARLVLKVMVCIFATIALLGIVSSVLAPVPTIPLCQEDEIIIGIGDFDGTYWEEYQCIAGDDYEGKGF